MISRDEVKEELGQRKEERNKKWWNQNYYKTKQNDKTEKR
jgi:hypothetical protein